MLTLKCTQAHFHFCNRKKWFMISRSLPDSLLAARAEISHVIYAKFC